MTDIKKQLQTAFQFRHACKDFLPDKKIKEADFDLILESAYTSPSSFGFEPWKFLVIQNPAIREKLKPFAWGAQNQLPNSSHFVVILARKGAQLTPKASYIEHMMKEVKQLPAEVVEMMTTFYTKFQKEDFKIDKDKDRFDWAKRQTYIPLANMMNTAALLEIDSCPIEGFQEEAMNELLAKHCQVNLEEFGISVMVAFGYRTESPRHPKSRQSKNEMVEII